ncbi:MAG: hydrogenase expression/formation protein [Nitrospirae bacterium]|nr:hydrogenase expression/formation protein [Nitrospirota bacterium]
MYLLPGKLPLDILEKFLKEYTSTNHGVVIGPSIGEDAAVIDIGDKYLLAKTDPITFVAEDIGSYTIFINANDIATMGGIPKWFLATILLPEKHTTSKLAENIFHQLSSACKKIDVAFCGGHTEITIGIDRPIVIGMMLGEVDKNDLITTAGARVGDDIILTKAIAIEAVSIIARKKSRELIGIFGEEFVDICRKFTEKPGISILREAQIARHCGEIHSMHDPTEGGLATGLYEVAKAADVGLVIYEDMIPVIEECKVLCNHYGLNPLGIIASGSLLITLGPNDTEHVISSLNNEGIPASRIGKIVFKEEGIKIKKGDQIKDLTRFKRDEITKIFEC